MGFEFIRKALVSMPAFIFPGQGAQYVGMGKDLYDAFPEVRDIFHRASQILGFGLESYCFTGPPEQLRQTSICQPAIVVTAIAALEALRVSLRANLAANKFLKPSFCAGLSLGEYTALIASGALVFEDGLCLVKKRAELMEGEAQRHPGKMVAVLGLDKEVLKEVCQLSHTEIANLNCPGQTVISGEANAIETAKDIILGKGTAAKVIDLDVSGAFHSSLMKEAAVEFKAFLDNFRLAAGFIPVVSNVTARPQSQEAEIKGNLVRQMYSPVLWEDSIRFMAARGVRSFYEIGPGVVLKGLARKIDSSLEVKNITTLEDIKAVTSV